MLDKVVFTESEVSTLEKIKSPMCIYFYKDRKLQTLVATDGLCSFFKLERKSLINLLNNEINDHVYHKDLKDLQNNISEIYKKLNEPFTLEYRFRFNKDSEYFWLVNECSPEIISSNSHIIYVTFRNNTPSHKYKKEHTNLIDKVENNSDSISPLEINSNILALNKSMTQANFLYWIYDVKKELLFNGNVFNKTMGENKFLKNYPQVFFDYHVIHIDDIQHFSTMFERSLSGEENVEENIRVLHPEKNDYILAHIRFLTVKDKDGKVTYIIGSAENFTTYGQAFNIINKLLNKNELITWNYIIKEGTFSYNDYGIKTKELKKISEIIYGAIDNGKITIPEAILKNKVNQTYEVLPFTDKYGKEFIFEITHTVYQKNNKPFTVIGMARNVTKFNEIEKAYIKELEKANTNKSSFLSRLSHDMRTPLGAIFSISKFGLEETKDPIAINYFSKIRDNSVYLLSFINDVLESRKINSGLLIFQPITFSPYSVVYQILSIIKLRADEKNINLIVETEGDTSTLYYYSDVSKIKQVAINLLTNAIKYTPRGGEVKFSLLCKKKDDHINIECIISDNGVGMSKEFQTKMFDEFSQETNILSFEEEGTGLGLSIVKQIVDLFNATIECESSPNNGTKFTINCQSDIATPQQIEEYTNKLDSEKLERLAGKKVLICEDKDINVMIISKLLKDKKMELDIAVNGLIGIDKVKQHHYDVILMDIRMPEIDGLKATKMIRKFNKTIPIIALSANASPEDIEQSISAGMNDHLSKP
ncbi:MAG: response regulator, partial [Spirochaetaceae bacterium]|nr:response regulator [Spirochaetaceae bacterium]